MRPPFHSPHHLDPHVHPPESAFNSPNIPPEPSSDPDPEPCRPDRAPSPLVAAPPRNLSVRQIAARLDETEGASEHRYSTAVPSDPAEYDPVREFSSSPNLWLTAKADAYIEHYDRTPNLARLLPTESPSNEPHQLTTGGETLPKPPQQPTHAPRSAHPDRPEIPYVAQEVAPQFSARPIRMLSLPAGSKYETVNDMYFGDDASSSQEIVDGGRRPSRAAPPETAYEDDDEGAAVEPVAPSPAERARARRDRVKVADVYDKGASSASTSKRHAVEVEGRYQESEHDRAATPLSPYVQASEDEGEEDDAWDNVEYVLTESYREGPKDSDIGIEGRPPRSSAWRLFSSIGQSFSKRKTDADEDVHQSTLAMGGSRYKSEKALSSGRGQMQRNRAWLGRGRATSGGLWLEFSSPLGVERMLGEVGKVAKALGYQVWRRPGESKLRCIRRLNHRQEMHMVIFVGSVSLPEGPVSVVRLKRARGDKNRTEAWRYSHFYRELVERLQRFGIEITSEV